jgi:hypothetical protein
MTRERLDADTIRADAVHQEATLMAAAAITAPKSGGQLLLAGKANFMETVIVEDAATRGQLADWMRERGKNHACPDRPTPSNNYTNKGYKESNGGDSSCFLAWLQVTILTAINADRVTATPRSWPMPG